MKKSILNLGKALNKAEQKNINGGLPLYPQECFSRFDCHSPENFFALCIKGRCIFSN